MVPVDDRGFLFGDGVYEVVKAFKGVVFTEAEHMERMRRGLRELGMTGALSAVDALPGIARRLLADNKLTGEDAAVYMQITRGAAPRAHAFPPATVPPTVYVYAKPFKGATEAQMTGGVAAVTMGDTRWSRCDIKSIALLPNVLANQKAKEAGAYECLFLRDGNLVEASHSNVFVVLDGELLTPPLDNILSGITRGVILAHAAELGLPVREARIPWARFPDFAELMVTASTTESLPVVSVDGKPVGSGVVGPVATRIRALFPEWIAADAKAAAASAAADAAAAAPATALAHASS